MMNRREFIDPMGAVGASVAGGGLGNLSNRRLPQSQARPGKALAVENRAAYWRLWRRKPHSAQIDGGDRVALFVHAMERTGLSDRLVHLVVTDIEDDRSLRGAIGLLHDPSNNPNSRLRFDLELLFMHPLPLFRRQGSSMKWRTTGGQSEQYWKKFRNTGMRCRGITWFEQAGGKTFFIPSR